MQLLELVSTLNGRESITLTHQSVARVLTSFQSLCHLDRPGLVARSSVASSDVVGLQDINFAHVLFARGRKILAANALDGGIFGAYAVGVSRTLAKGKVSLMCSRGLQLCSED